jgi:hypothetical protein
MKDLQKVIIQFSQKYNCTITIKMCADHAEGWNADEWYITIKNADFEHTVFQRKLDIKTVFREYFDICKMIDSFEKQQRESDIPCIFPLRLFPALYKAKEFTGTSRHPSFITVILDYIDIHPETLQQYRAKKSFTI